MNHWMIRPLLIAIAIISVSVASADVDGDEQPIQTSATPNRIDEKPADDDDKLRDEADRAAAEYRFAVGDNAENVVTLRKEPVLRWPNYQDNVIHGGTFVWTARGNPVAMGCIWRAYDKSWHFGFHSLTEEPLNVVRNGAAFWRTKKAGVTFQAVPGADAPVESPRLRLAQMRNIAREFQADVSLGFDPRRKWERLRLLEQPLYRYESTDPKIADGAIFAFVTGTDPEAILQVESRKDSAGKLIWYYAFSRRTAYALRAKLNETEVWTVDISHGAMDQAFYEK